ncbi:MAG: tetratricopeptide repeat protein [bacterium]
MARKRKHRLTRHDLKTDRFVESTMEFVTTAKHHAPRLVFSAIGFIFVLLIIAYIANGRKRANLQADQFLSSATASYMNGDFETARDALEDITTRFWGTRASHEALFYLGNTYYALNDYDNAIKNFEQFLKRRTKWPLLKASAAVGIANCYEQKGQYLLAAEEYEKVADRFPDSPIAPEALISAARCYQAMAQPQAAKPLYERLKKDYPNSPLVAMADMYLRIQDGAEQAVR